MAGDWIKMRCNLWDDPRVTAIVDAVNGSEAAVVGGLYWLWATADQHSQDGNMPGLSLRQIDRKTGIKGFGAALAAIGWIVEHDGGVHVPRFSEHNGQSAKSRALTARRVSKHKTLTANAGIANGATVTSTVTDPLPVRDLEKDIDKEEERARAKQAAAPPVDFRTDVFRRWKSLPDGGGGAFLARLCREHGEDEALNAADRAMEAERADPKGFVLGVLRGRAKADTAHDAMMAGVL